MEAIDRLREIKLAARERLNSALNGETAGQEADLGAASRAMANICHAEEEINDFAEGKLKTWGYL